MAWSVGLFGAECGSECVDLAEGQGTDLCFKLPTDCQIGSLPKEVLTIIYLTFRSAWRIHEIECGDAKHCPCTLGIGGSNDWRMDIEEVSFLKEAMNGKSEGVAYTKHGTKGIGAWTQMGNLPQELHRVAFLL